MVVKVMQRGHMTDISQFYLQEQNLYRWDRKNEEYVNEVNLSPESDYWNNQRVHWSV